MEAAINAIINADLAELARLLAARPELVSAVVQDERFVEAIVHQLYAGDRLLHVAAAAFHADLVAHLLDSGADILSRNRRGAQALHYAADTNHSAPNHQAATIAVLLAEGANPNARDNSGTTPLHRAVRTRSSAAVAALVDGGADVNLTNGSGSTPLMLAHLTTGRGGSGTPDAKAEQVKIIALLIDAGAKA